VVPPPARPSVFSARPWRPADGDPARPWSVNGIAVAAVLRSRRDRPGALVALVDGRFAVTGSHLIVGGGRGIVRYIRDHAPASFGDEAERGWWQEVAGVLANPPRRALGPDRERR
jgi:potassium/hydrogen antiporter